MEWDGWTLNQLKTKTNPRTKPKYTIPNGIPVETYDNTFMGLKVFGYKLGNGAVDPPGMKLSYKDTPWRC